MSLFQSRRQGKEFEVFVGEIMWCREDCEKIILCRDKIHQRHKATQILRWLDTKHIQSIGVDKQKDVQNIEIKNFCGKKIKIVFKISNSRD